MSEPNVIVFPNRGVPTVAAAAAPTTVSQGDLFRDERHGNRAFAFMPVDRLTQDEFLRIIARNGVRAVVDIRQRPIFKGPRFVHSQVAHYLFARNIAYVECAMLSLYDRSSAVPTLRDTRAFSEVLESLMPRGMVLFVYDEQARAVGLVDRIRDVVRGASTSAVEVLPRSIL